MENRASTPIALDIGCKVVSLDGARLGEVKEIRAGSFKVDAPMQRDYWLEQTCITSSAADCVTVSFPESELESHKRPASPGEDPAELARANTDAELAPRERMERELDAQRNRLQD